MCKVQNKEDNQQVRQTSPDNDQPIWDIPVPRRPQRIPPVSINDIRRILAATEEFDNRSFDTVIDDNWSITSSDTATTEGSEDTQDV